MTPFPTKARFAAAPSGQRLELNERPSQDDGECSLMRFSWLPFASQPLGNRLLPYPNLHGNVVLGQAKLMNVRDERRETRIHAQVRSLWRNVDSDYSTWSQATQ